MSSFADLNSTATLARECVRSVGTVGYSTKDVIENVIKCVNQFKSRQLLLSNELTKVMGCKKFSDPDMSILVELQIINPPVSNKIGLGFHGAIVKSYLNREVDIQSLVKVVLVRSAFECHGHTLISALSAMTTHHAAEDRLLHFKRHRELQVETIANTFGANFEKRGRWFGDLKRNIENKIMKPKPKTAFSPHQPEIKTLTDKSYKDHFDLARGWLTVLDFYDREQKSLTRKAERVTHFKKQFPTSSDQLGWVIPPNQESACTALKAPPESISNIWSVLLNERHWDVLIHGNAHTDAASSNHVSEKELDEIANRCFDDLCPPTIKQVHIDRLRQSISVLLAATNHCLSSEAIDGTVERLMRQPGYSLGKNRVGRVVHISRRS